MPAKKEEVVAEPVETKEGANGSRYELVGKCAVCGMKLWICVTKPNIDLAITRMESPVYVNNGRVTGGEETEKTVYCKRHDPYAHLKRNRGLKPGEELPGDLYQPQTR